MKVDHDTIKEKWIAIGYSYYEACGKATAEICSLIRGWTGPIKVFFGPPGSGKSKLVAGLEDTQQDLILETSGLNPSINYALLEDRQRTQFFYVATERFTCIDNVKKRPARQIDMENSHWNLINMILRFFDVYNSGDQNWRLPTDQKVVLS